MKKILSILLTIAVVITTVFTAFARDIETVWAELRPDFTIIIDGDKRGFESADGDYLYPIFYNDTTYLPLRAIGEIMGKTVNWDEENKTVTLSGSKKSAVVSPSKRQPSTKDIKVQLRPDFTIVIDNKTRELKTAGGKAIYPILYNGSTYLPLRAIGEIMGKTVDWDNDDKIVTLKESSSTVTDADTFYNEEDNTDKKITVDNAKKIALDHAKLKESQVEFIYSDLDYDNSRWVYDIEFYVGYDEYDYEIDALTGDIISYDYDADYYTPPKENKDNYISQNDAIKKVLAKVPGATAKNVKIELDYDDGKAVFEGEIKYKGMEYEFEIEAKTGEILKWKVDRDD